jgi:hypothetical protein
MKKKSLFLALALAASFGISAAGAAAPPTNADVGDAGSFGSNVIWMGLVSTGVVFLATDCTPLLPDLGPDDRCVTLSGSTTHFEFADLGRITLPANSANTLICHWATPSGYYVLNNPTAATATASFRLRPTYRIESKVLQGPTFNGGIDVSLSGPLDIQTLAPGAQQTHSITASRDCIGGLITKASLVNDYGLTEAQAKSFFQGPITIRAGVSGDVTRVSDGQIIYGTRLTGDHP